MSKRQDDISELQWYTQTVLGTLGTDTIGWH